MHNPQSDRFHINALNSLKLMCKVSDCDYLCWIVGILLLNIFYMHFYTHYASYYLLNNVTFLNEKYAKIEKFKRTQATISMLMIMR